MKIDFGPKTNNWKYFSVSNSEPNIHRSTQLNTTLISFPFFWTQKDHAAKRSQVLNPFSFSHIQISKKLQSSPTLQKVTSLSTHLLSSFYRLRSSLYLDVLLLFWVLGYSRSYFWLWGGSFARYWTLCYFLYTDVRIISFTFNLQRGCYFIYVTQ